MIIPPTTQQVLASEEGEREPRQLRHLKKIAFFTNAWSNITLNVRTGGKLAGTASVYKIWERCRHHGLETHVFIVSSEGEHEPREFNALNGVQFHWLRPFAHNTIRTFQRCKLGFLMAWTKPIDWLRVFRACRKHCPDAEVYYSQRWGLAAPALALAKWTAGTSIVRYYGTFIYEEWMRGNWRGKLLAFNNALVMKFPFDLQIMTNDGTRGDVVFQALRVPIQRRRFWLNGINKNMRIPDLDIVRAKSLIDSRLTADTPVLMCVGRLSYWKRQDLLLKALPAILDQVPNAKLLLVGSGEYEPQLRALCNELNLQESVIFCGAVANAELPTYLNCADIYLQVNDVSNVSTTLIEALSAGCCCVARDEGGMDAIIDNGQNAILIQGDDPQDIAAVCIDLLKNPERREAFRERALQDAARRFQTWDERLDMELMCIDELVGKSQKHIAH